MARGFSFDELTRHVLILGKPGQGKTNLLLSLLLQLGDPALQAKHPSAQIFIDPHGDTSFRLARTMKDWSKLLLLDPTEIQLSMNPLELLPYETEDERIFQIQMTVSELLMILEDILKTDLDRASRMSWIFTGGLYFLYHFTGSPTFVDLYDLMIDFQTLPMDEVEAMLKNANVPDEILEKTMEAIARLENAAYSPVLNRIAKFIIPSGSYAARTFCCRKTNVPWELMLEPGRATIISVSKSDLPNEFRELLTNSLVMEFHFLIQQIHPTAGPSGLSRLVW